MVIPVFNERDGLPELYSRLKKVMDLVDSLAYEIIFVDNGSQDESYNFMVSLAGSDPTVRIIKFSRNFGHQLAITAGMNQAKGDAIMVIDADLQDPSEVIGEFVKRWQEGNDVVNGIREKRPGESRMKLLTARVFYRILKKLVGIEIPSYVGYFIDGITSFSSLPLKLASWLGAKQRPLYIIDEIYERNSIADRGPTPMMKRVSNPKG